MGNLIKLVLGAALLALLVYGLNAAQVLKLSPEDKINAAIPVSESVSNAEKKLMGRLEGDRRDTVEDQLATRLKLRALNCANGYTPSWLTREDDIRKALEDDRGCFAESDKEIARWLGLVQVGLMLAEPPLKPVPEAVPDYIVAESNITNARFAAKAGIALLETSQTLEIVDVSDGKKLYKEAREPGAPGELSANGRLFYAFDGNRLRMRESASGEIVAEIPQIRPGQFFWGDAQVAFYNRGDTGKPYLIDWASGKEILVEAANRGIQFVAAVPGHDNEYVLLSYGSATKIEVDRSGGEPEIRLLGDKQVMNNFWPRGQPVTGPGDMLFFAQQNGLGMMKLQGLQYESLSFEPFYLQSVVATAEPGELLITVGSRAPSGQRIQNYLFEIGNRLLKPLDSPATMGARFVYIPSVGQLASIRENRIAMMKDWPTRAAIPLDEFLATELQAVNQAKLDAFDRQQRMLSQAGQYPRPIEEAPAPEAAAALDKRAPATHAVQAATAAMMRGARVEAVGVYQGPKSGLRSEEGRNMGQVTVNVRRASQPVVVVLSSYEPVLWNLKLDPGVQLRAVLVSGYHASRVTGAGSARVLQIGRNYAYAFNGAGYGQLNRDVMQWSGRAIDIFQGRYEGLEFSVGG